MRTLLVALCGFVAVASVAATCVSNVEQKGPLGPWVGEVVNTGPGAVQDVMVYGRVRDADGRPHSDVGGGSCPSALLPGERGAFEAFFDPGFNPPPVLPLDVHFPPVAFADYPGTAVSRSDGLLLTVIEENRVEKFARVEVQNYSQYRYADINVCGILRREDGRVAAVGQSQVVADEEFPSRDDWLQPGQSLTLEVYFDEMPSGTVRLYARADSRDPQTYCCSVTYIGWTRVDTGSFSLMLPPGWVFTTGQGIDSSIGTIRGDGAELFFDYGIYSGSLPPPNDPAHNVIFETIGGLTAQIATPSGVDGTTGVYFGDTGKTMLGGAVRFKLSGTAVPDEQRDQALNIFRTIRFE